MSILASHRLNDIFLEYNLLVYGIAVDAEPFCLCITQKQQKTSVEWPNVSVNTTCEGESAMTATG